MYAELKVPKGKLIRVTCDIHENRIQSLRYTGDFFFHPEEGLQKLESALTGQPADPSILRQRVREFFKKTDCTLVGVTPESFIDVIEKALQPERA